MSHALLAAGVDVAHRELHRLARRQARLELPVKARDTADLLAHLHERARYAGVLPPAPLDLSDVAPDRRLRVIANWLRIWASEQEHRNVLEMA